MSLLIWMPLDGNTNNKGLLDSGTTSVSSSGTVGTELSPFRVSYHFADGGYLYTSDMEFELSDSFSIAAWIKIDRETGPQPQGLFNILAEEVFGYPRNAVSVVYENNNRFSFRIINMGLQDPWATSVVKENFELKKWYHVALVINKTNVSLFINGIFVKDITLPNECVSISYKHVLLGAYIGSLGHTLNGSMSDFRVYNSALSIKEIKELAKGLLVKIPLDWGARYNYVAESYKWMNLNLGHDEGTVTNKSVIWNDFAPSPYVFSMTLKNNSTSKVENIGVSYNKTDQGISGLLNNTTYTYSFWAKIDGDSTGINEGLKVPNNIAGQTFISSDGFGPLSTAWRRHSYTFKVMDNSKANLQFLIDAPAKTEYTIRLCGLKLERFDGSTPYVPKEDETIYSQLAYDNMAFEDVSGRGFNVINSGCINGGNNSFAKPPIGITSTAHTEFFQELKFEKDFSSGGVTFSEITINLWFLEWNNIVSTPHFYSFANGSFLKTWKDRNVIKTAFRDKNNVSTTIEYNCPIPSGEEWHMLTQTFNNGIFRIYLDGVLKDEVNKSTVSPYLSGSSNDPYFIGYEKDDEENNMRAYFSDFRVYVTCLSADDILQLYKGRQCIDKTGKLYCNEIVES